MKYTTFKRLMDILVSLITITILLPLFLPVMLLLRITDEGEVFYRQDRVGFKNQIFRIWKFATMLKDSPNMGTGDITLRNDPRVTKVGKYLRMTKTNEWPQIINILTGDMSFVGPRPLMKAGFDGYSDEFKKQVYNVNPGLTGIGSVVFRDEEKILTESGLPPRECYNTIILPHKGALEVWYQKNISFLTDLKVLFLTAWVIIFPESKLPYRIFKDLPERISESELVNKKQSRPVGLDQDSVTLS